MMRSLTICDDYDVMDDIVRRILDIHSSEIEFCAVYMELKTKEDFGWERMLFGQIYMHMGLGIRDMVNQLPFMDIESVEDDGVWGQQSCSGFLQAARVDERRQN
ncbi:hypothetical protein Tco_0729492 [Tanacetum coccineum]|uniref:Uncharacterized protein n=1 Tax=Tanacetum coccineum TaxID=301880 RepID=A0ABQ4YQ74_9ASTR